MRIVSCLCRKLSELKDERRETSSGWFTGKSRKPKSERKEKKQKPEKQEGGFFTKIEDVFGGIFSEEDDE